MLEYLGLDWDIHIAPSLWTAGFVSLFFIAFFLKSWVNFIRIPKLPRTHPGTEPDCMVVIPARNEEASIARAVSSFPNDTVIVVDDFSSDETAEAARRAGAGVVPAPELAAGFIGKSNACAAGARLLQSRWILFTDADTWFDPGFLNTAVACAEASGVAFLSVYLKPSLDSFAEAVLVPYAMALYFCGIKPKGDPIAIFNGQCVLVRRDAYEFVGGHTAVATILVEDVKLAALALRHRLRIATVRSADSGHVRFHREGLWNGFERNAFRFILVSPWAGITIFMAAFCAALWLPMLAWLLVDHQYAAAIAFGLLPFVILGVWYRNPMRALLAPFAIYPMFFVILNGTIAALTGRHIEWKGREI